MVKISEEIQNNNIMPEKAGVCFGLSGKNANLCRKSLVSEINCLMKINPFEDSTVGFLQLEDELRNEKVRTLIFELANAIDKNSGEEVRILKNLYGTSKEFAAAKKFLNKKCKDVWDVFENKKVKMTLPQNAMKALGITNKPDLGFLLGNSLKYFEKENSEVTANIISSVLSNVNLDYSLDDICEYLQQAHKKRVFEYNMNTVKFLAHSLTFNRKKLDFLGISNRQMSNIFKDLPLKEKISCIKNYYLG